MKVWIFLLGMTFILGTVALPSGSAAAPSNAVTLTMKVKGCEGCQITAYHTSGESFYTQKSTVKGGVAKFVIPAEKTIGMSFDVVHRPQADALGGGAVPVIAMGFKDVPDGSVVSKEQTRKKGAKASWCWAGSAAGNVTMTINTYFVKLANPPAWSGPLWMYAWASPTEAVYSTPGWRPAKAMGHQDAPYC